MQSGLAWESEKPYCTWPSQNVMYLGRPQWCCPCSDLMQKLRPAGTRSALPQCQHRHVSGAFPISTTWSHRKLEMFAARFFCSHTCLATWHKKRHMKTYMRPNLCQGFTVTGLSKESSATAPVPRISALEMNFCGSFRILLPRDTLWSRGMCLNIQNTLLTRDLKQFQNKCSTFCTLIFLSQYDSDPKMPWFIISSHTDLKLKICLSLLSLRK